MKRKGIIILASIVTVIILSYAIYVFTGTQNAKNLMWEYLDEKGYAQTEIQDITVHHSILNTILSYNEWNIKVIYTDEPTSIYSYHMKDGIIVEGGVSGATNKEDLKH
jgi:hypothetical protein